MNEKSHRPHYPTSFLGSCKIILWGFFEIFANFGGMLKLRAHYQKSTPNPEIPRVALLGDNLDEVNGISITSRTLVRTMRKKNRPVYLIGVAFHTKKPRMVPPGTNIFMVPGRCSMDQVGYADSEVTIPRVKFLLRLFKRYPVDIVEIEVPGGFGFIALVVSKVIGIKTIIHYRTDLIAFFKVLIPSKLGVAVLNTWVKYFTLLGKNVVIPSDAFFPKMRAFGVPHTHITKLPRSVDLTMFHPDKGKNGEWEKCTQNLPGIRIIYMGRISREKGLSILFPAIPILTKKYPNISFTIVGKGPYLPDMEKTLKPYPNVEFTGVLRGNALAGVLAASDIMIFPSTTDTFGNTVLEALASGIPAIVSNMGGPQEIIEDNISGLVFKGDDHLDFCEKLGSLISNPNKLSQFKSQSRQRALLFTHDKSADAFWQYYQNILRS